VANPFRRRRHEQRTLSRESVPNVWLSGTTIASAPVSADAALRLTDVYACVALLARSASLTPLHAFRRTPAGRVRVQGPATELLWQPAPATSQANFIAQCVGSLALRGEFFCGKFKRGGELVQLGLLPIDRITVEIKNGEPRYTITHDTGRQTVHGTDDVLHVKTWTVDGVRGASPIAYCRESLGLATALRDTASALFTNQSTPRGILSVAPSAVQGDVMENLKTAWETRHGGPQNQGRIAVIAGESVTFQPVSITPGDAEFVSQRKLSTAEFVA
jgi:HK97 family phage portal protein